MFGVVKDIPEIAVDAQLPSIELEMSEDDYKTIMQTLSGNLAEGKDLLDEAVPPPPPSITQTVAAVEETDRVKIKLMEFWVTCQSRRIAKSLTCKSRILPKFEYRQG